MRSGLLRHRITWQMPVSATNPRGEKIKTWVDYRTVWAQIQPTGGRDFLDVHQTESETTATITQRYLPGLKAYMRGKFKDRYYEIVHIINSEERDRMQQVLIKELESG